MSYTALAESFGIGRFLLSSTQSFIAASPHSNDLLVRFALERQEAKPIADFDFVLHVVYEWCDAATMPISVRRTVGLGLCVPPLADTRSSSTVCEPDTFLQPDKDSGPCKLVQSTHSFRMVLKNKALGDGAGEDGYFAVAGDTLIFLQAVHRRATEVFPKLPRLRSGAGLSSKSFRTTARVVTEDHHAAQFKAERVMQAELDGALYLFHRV